MATRTRMVKTTLEPCCMHAFVVCVVSSCVHENRVGWCWSMLWQRGFKDNGSLLSASNGLQDQAHPRQLSLLCVS